MLRDRPSGTILLAKSLLSAAQDDLASLIRQVKEALPVPIWAVISDGQNSLRPAMEAVLPGIPHQLCQFHYLRQAARPIYEADRQAKKELKKRLRGIRPLEHGLSGQDDDQAQIIRGYCLAVRSALTDRLSLPPWVRPGRWSMTQDALERFLETLRRARWNVVTSPDNSLSLNGSLLERYPRIPDAYLTFLRHVAECSNPPQNAWFLCTVDYNTHERNATTFRWNEWEQLSLDAAEDDPKLIRSIVTFWDNHLPIMSAVHSDYAYLAIALSSAEYGAIYYGYGPEFEESARKVCNSFEEYLNTFERMVAGAISVEYQDEAGNQLICREFSDFL